MSLTETSDRFTTLPDEHTLAATVVALEEHGFSVEVVDDLDAEPVLLERDDGRGERVLVGQRGEAVGCFGQAHGWSFLGRLVPAYLNGLYPA